MRTNIRRVFISVVAAAFSVSALAGLKSAAEVTISDTYGWAYGDVGHVYGTSDRTQMIGCDVDGGSGYCYARDVNNVYRSCWSDDARWVRAMGALKGDSYVVFYWDSNSHCTYVGVQNDSLTDRK